jgi:hypothetical protein
MSTQDDIDDRIDALEREREQLRAREGASDRTQEQDVARLDEIQAELERLFDLKRRRRAAVDAGQDPDAVQERSVEDVRSDLG